MKVFPQIIVLPRALVLASCQEVSNCDFRKDDGQQFDRSKLYHRARNDIFNFYQDSYVTEMGQEFPEVNEVLRAGEIYACHQNINDDDIICYMGSEHNNNFHLYSILYQYNGCRVGETWYMLDSYISKEDKIEIKNGKMKIKYIATATWQLIDAD